MFQENKIPKLISFPKLASTKKPGNNHTVIQETLPVPSIEVSEVNSIEQSSTWMTPIQAFLQNDILPSNTTDAKKLRREVAKYTIISDKLYKRGYSTPLLRCLTPSEADYVMHEIHEGICGSHIGGRSLANKVICAGYYWPRLDKDCLDFVKRCDKCQRHAEFHHASTTALQSVTSPWPFYKWGADILGPFPLGPGQVKYLIVAIEYFTKWVEAEPVATITAARVKKFYWRNIICRFGMPAEIVSDNGTQFASTLVTDFFQELGIKNKFTSVEHPQANGQAEAANKVILSGLKRKLDESKGAWADNLCQVIWSLLLHIPQREKPHSG